MFPFSSSVTRRLAFLHRIARGSLLRLLRYHHGAPTSCRPFRPTHCSFVGRYHALLRLMRKRGELPSAGSLSELRRCLNPLPSPALVETRRDLPGSWAAPSRTCSALRPRRTGCAKATNDASDVAFRSVDNVGSAIGHLSRLNHTACSLAVYASRLGLLRSHHARLASRWRPTLAGQGLNLLGCFRRFLSVMFTSHHFDPPSPSFAWRTNRRDAVRLGTSRRLGRRAEAGPCQLHTKVRRRVITIVRSSPPRDRQP